MNLSALLSKFVMTWCSQRARLRSGARIIGA
jgi:hypothetical protein